MARVRGKCVQHRRIHASADPRITCSIAYIECHGAANATTLKEWFDSKYVTILLRLVQVLIAVHSEFQNRRASATYTATSQGNPFRTLPKGKSSVQYSREHQYQ